MLGIFLIQHSPEALRARENSQKMSLSKFVNKSWEFGFLHKIRLEGDYQTLTFGLMQHVDTMQPRGATRTLRRD